MIKHVLKAISGNLAAVGFISFATVYNTTNLSPKTPAIVEAVIIIINAMVIAINLEQVIAVIKLIEPKVYSPVLLYNWLYQRYYRPSSTTIMARHMYSVAFGKPNNRLVVMLAKPSWVASSTLGVAVIEMNLVLMSPQTGAMGPYGVLHTMLHELTHMAGFLGHERNFQEAYMSAGQKFKWFNRVNGSVFSYGAVNGNRVFNGFVR